MYRKIYKNYHGFYPYWYLPEVDKQLYFHHLMLHLQQEQKKKEQLIEKHIVIDNYFKH